MTVADRVRLPMLRDRSLLRSQAYVDGRWIDGNACFDVHDPADLGVITAVPDLSAEDAAAAIAAAAAAQPAWAALPATRRSAFLRRWFDLVLTNEQDLAVLISAEEGKPLAEALAEVRYGASFIEWFAEEAKRVYGETIPAPAADRRILVLRQPIGVVAAITPWNFPLAMITRKAAAAMAAGCAIVVKPSELTPLTALALAALAESAGVPAGILNVITTSDPVSVGQQLCGNPLVRKISFTGSTEVGRILLRQSADTIKKCSMELGGNAPVLVFDDADLSAAIRGTLAAKFRNAGQACIAANRILVQRNIYPAFAAQLSEEVHRLRVGHGLSQDVAIGPLVDAGTFDKVSRHVANAVERGATIAVGGSRHALGGTFFQPTVLTGVSADMDVFREETFGPVAALVPFSDEADAIALANDSEFGLAAYVFTRDLGRALRVSEALEAGMIGLNEGIISTEVAPFGGVKQSGLGREGSRHGIEEYLEIKYICIGGM
ncbi:NAD-dependent succinate-semialdehyde dehydrogenase [Sphingobium sp. HWE2-09]|uniref:NAD-dependent succinate-semialdehyde dehydrogenase n=1 Tax=Sphingobium sp. HWE2-09 TaxID=3108390 RepID=UPI002DD16BE5|nr:NAD-dependent succinate-semialdehyde dehydrogenase [Sphingobium sp. HWE2-09]